LCMQSACRSIMCAQAVTMTQCVSVMTTQYACMAVKTSASMALKDAYTALWLLWTWPGTSGAQAQCSGETRFAWIWLIMSQKLYTSLALVVLVLLLLLLLLVLLLLLLLLLLLTKA